MPLCDECTYGTDESKPSGNWGFLNHTHVSKPEFSDKHENRRLREDLASAVEERDRLREALQKISQLDYSRAAVNGCAYAAVVLARAALSPPTAEGREP
jgi:hypothetical protein